MCITRFIMNKHTIYIAHLLITTAFLSFDAHSILKHKKYKKKDLTAQHNSIMSEMQKSPLFLQKQEELRNAGFNIEVDDQAQKVQLDLASPLNALTLIKQIMDKAEYGIPAQIQEKMRALTNEINEILSNENQISIKLMSRYSALDGLINSIVEELEGRLQTLKDLLISVKHVLKVVVRIADLELYYKNHEQQILEYKKDYMEAFGNFNVQLPADAANTIKVNFGFELKSGSGFQNDDFIKTKSKGFGIGAGGGIDKIAQFGVSGAFNISSSERYVSMMQIASTRNTADKVKGFMSQHTTDEYKMFYMLMMSLATDISSLKEHMYRIESLVRTMGIIGGYDVLLFKFDDGSYTTEFIKSVSAKSIIKINSDLLTALGLTATIEHKRSNHSTLNQSRISLAESSVKLKDKDYGLELLTVIEDSKDFEHFLKYGDRSAFEKLQKASGINSIKQLLDRSKQYVDAITYSYVKDKKASKFRRSLKQQMEKELGTVGRKATAKLFMKLLAYYCYTGSNSDTDMLNDTKNIILRLADFVEDSNSILKTKRSLQKRKTYVSETISTISFMNDFIKFSHSRIDGDPFIENNGDKINISINLHMLRLMNKVVDTTLGVIQKIAKILKIDENKLKPNGNQNTIVSDCIFTICSNLCMRIEEGTKSSKNQKLAKSLELFRLALGELALTFGNLEEVEWQHDLPGILSLLNKHALFITAEGVANSLTEQDFMFSRIFALKTKELGASLGISHNDVDSSNKVGIKSTEQSENIYENPNSLYSFMFKYIKHARAKTADAHTYTLDDAIKFLIQYNKKDELLKSAFNGLLDKSYMKYKNASRRSLRHDSLRGLSDDEIINKLANVAYDYKVKVADSHYSRTYGYAD